MKTFYKKFLIGSAALLFTLCGGVESGQADTLFTLEGSYGGSLVPENAGNQTDYFNSSISGTLNFDQSTGLADLNIDLVGQLFDDIGRTAQIGTFNANIIYRFENVIQQVLTGPNGTQETYLLSLTEPNDGPGDGLGSFANITVTAAGQTDTATFDLDAMAFRPNPNADWFPDYQPISDFLLNNGAGAYLIVGDLAGFDNAVKAWLASDFFNLALGANRTGNFSIHGDLHARFIDNPGGEPVPEPTSMVLLGSALLGVASRKRIFQKVKE